MTTTATDRYALALATIGLRVTRLDIDARRSEDDDPETAAHLSRQASEARALLLEVINADLLEENPDWTPEVRAMMARRHCGRILRDCEQARRGER